MKSLLLAALILGVTVAVSAEQSEQKSMLRAFELSCFNCTTLQYGDPADGDLIQHVCPEGTLCGPVNGAHSCVPEADAADCSCGGQENVFIPEPYDKNKYIACLPDGTQSTLSCADGEIFTGNIDEPCVTGPKCDSTAVVGYNLVMPACNQYFFCKTNDDSITDVPTFECPEGQVYDTTMLGCKDPCTLAPEPFVCGASDSGPFPDPEDCQIFHICFGGNNIGNPIPCPDDKYFDIESGACDGDDANVCKQETDECYLHYKDEC